MILISSIIELALSKSILSIIFSVLLIIFELQNLLILEFSSSLSNYDNKLSFFFFKRINIFLASIFCE